MRIQTGFDPRFGEQPRSWTLVQLPGGKLDIDRLIFDLEHLPIDGQRPDGGYYNSQVNVTHRHTSWGADGSAIEAVLNIGLGLASNVIYQIVISLFEKYGRPSSPGATSHDWTDDEVVQRVTSMVARQSGMRAAEIDPVSIERKSDRSMATVVLMVAGKRHQVALKVLNGIPIIESHDREL